MSLYFVVSRRAEKTFQIDAINLHFSMVWLMCVLIVLIKLSSQFVFGILTDNVHTIYQVTEDFCGFVALKRTDAETTMSIWARLRWLFNHILLSVKSGNSYYRRIESVKYSVHFRSHCLN